MNSTYPLPRFAIGQRVVLNDYSQNEDTGAITPHAIAGTVYGIAYNPSWGMPGWYCLTRFDNGIDEPLHESLLTPEL